MSDFITWLNHAARREKESEAEYDDRLISRLLVDLMARLEKVIEKYKESEKPPEPKFEPKPLSTYYFKPIRAGNWELGEKTSKWVGDEPKEEI